MEKTLDNMVLIMKKATNIGLMEECLNSHVFLFGMEIHEDIEATYVGDEFSIESVDNGWELFRSMSDPHLYAIAVDDQNKELSAEALFILHQEMKRQAYILDNYDPTP